MNMVSVAYAYLPTISSMIRTDLTIPTTLHKYYFSKSNGSTLTCKASSSSSSYSSMLELDTYDLLSIDSSFDQSQMKTAYRFLQKRCHPDFVGPSGHNMAIILNEAYAILSELNLRLAYDKEQAKISEFKGFTGRPIYSIWRGSESEQWTIFVDKIKCVSTWLPEVCFVS